jgi:serine/threonine protein kinase
VLSPEKALSPAHRSRLLREAQIASNLNHAAICTVYDIGTHEGHDYVCFEFVEGRTLKEVIAEGRLPIEVAVRLGAEISSGLSYAHHRGVVHRDVKPSNIMIGSDGRAKILDFGVARIVTTTTLSHPEDEDTRTKLTDTGAIVGTASYMSPEQALGREVDPRSDIFSLGSVLYEMLTGQVAFGGSTHVEAMYRVVHTEAIPLADLRPEAPAELSRIIALSHAKKASDRYATIGALSLDLRRLERHPFTEFLSLDERRTEGARPEPLLARELPALYAPLDAAGASPSEATTLSNAAGFIGRYRISRLLGEGAMGRVWHAIDPERHLPVVIKELKEQFRDPANLTRFVREAQMAAKLQHRNIVGVVEASSAPPLLVMEYFPAEALSTLMREKKPITLALIVSVLSQACDGLEYLHAHDVVHGDLKPANILVRDDGAVKLADVGISKAPFGQATMTGVIDASVAYMSPERIVSGGRIDGRADLWALGVVLYELVQGRHPFPGETISIQLYSIVHEPLPDFREMPREIEAPVQDLLYQALAKSPKARIQSAAEFREHLRSLLGAVSDPERILFAS